MPTTATLELLIQLQAAAAAAELKAFAAQVATTGTAISGSFDKVALQATAAADRMALSHQQAAERMALSAQEASQRMTLSAQEAAQAITLANTQAANAQIAATERAALSAQEARQRETAAAQAAADARITASERAALAQQQIDGRAALSAQEYAQRSGLIAQEAANARIAAEERVVLTTIQGNQRIELANVQAANASALQAQKAADAQILQAQRAADAQVAAATRTGTAWGTAMRAVGEGMLIWFAVQQAAQAVGSAVDSTAGVFIRYDAVLTQTRNNTQETAQGAQDMGVAIYNALGTINEPLDKLADGYRRVADFGYTGADANNVFTASARLAAATGADVGSLTQLAAQSMRAYGLETTQTSNVLGVFMIGAQTSAQTLEAFGGNAQRAAALSAALGIPLNEVVSALSALTIAGYSSAQAQTAYISSATHIINPSKAAQAELERLQALLVQTGQATGIDLPHAFTAAGLATNGYVGTLGMIREAYSRLKASQVDQVASQHTLFETVDAGSTIFEKFGLSQADATGESLKLVNAQRGGIPVALLSGQYWQQLNSINTQAAATLRGELNPALEAEGRTAATTANQIALLKGQQQQFALAMGQSMQGASLAWETFVTNVQKGLLVFTSAGSYEMAYAKTLAASGQITQEQVAATAELARVTERASNQAAVYGTTLEALRQPNANLTQEQRDLRDSLLSQFPVLGDYGNALHQTTEAEQVATTATTAHAAAQAARTAAMEGATNAQDTYNQALRDQATATAQAIDLDAKQAASVRAFASDLASAIKDVSGPIEKQNPAAALEKAFQAARVDLPPIYHAIQADMLAWATQAAAAGTLTGAGYREKLIAEMDKAIALSTGEIRAILLADRARIVDFAAVGTSSGNAYLDHLISGINTGIPALDSYLTQLMAKFDTTDITTYWGVAAGKGYTAALLAGMAQGLEEAAAFADAAGAIAGPGAVDATRRANRMRVEAGNLNQAAFTAARNAGLVPGLKPDPTPAQITSAGESMASSLTTAFTDALATDSKGNKNKVGAAWLAMVKLSQADRTNMSDGLRAIADEAMTVVTDHLAGKPVDLQAAVRKMVTEGMALKDDPGAQAVFTAAAQELADAQTTAVDKAIKTPRKGPAAPDFGTEAQKDAQLALSAYQSAIAALGQADAALQGTTPHLNEAMKALLAVDVKPLPPAAEWVRQGIAAILKEEQDGTLTVAKANQQLQDLLKQGIASPDQPTRIMSGAALEAVGVGADKAAAKLAKLDAAAERARQSVMGNLEKIGEDADKKNAALGDSWVSVLELQKQATDAKMPEIAAAAQGWADDIAAGRITSEQQLNAKVAALLQERIDHSTGAERQWAQARLADLQAANAAYAAEQQKAVDAARAKQESALQTIGGLVKDYTGVNASEHRGDFMSKLLSDADLAATAKMPQIHDTLMGWFDKIRAGGTLDIAQMVKDISGWYDTLKANGDAAGAAMAQQWTDNLAAMDREQKKLQASQDRSLIGNLRGFESTVLHRQTNPTDAATTLSDLAEQADTAGLTALAAQLRARAQAVHDGVVGALTDLPAFIEGVFRDGSLRGTAALKLLGDAALAEATRIRLELDKAARTAAESAAKQALADAAQAEQARQGLAGGLGTLGMDLLNPAKPLASLIPQLVGLAKQASDAGLGEMASRMRAILASGGAEGGKAFYDEVMAWLRQLAATADPAVRAIAAAMQQQIAQAAALRPLQDRLEGINAALHAEQETAKGLSAQLNEATAALQRYSSARFIGEGASDDAIEKKKEQIARLQLQIDQLRASPYAAGYAGQIAALSAEQAQVAAQQKVLEDQAAVQYGPGHYAVQRAVRNATPEMTQAAALAGTERSEAAIARFAPMLASTNAQIAALTDQQTAAQDALTAATKAFQAETAALPPFRQALQETIGATGAGFHGMVTDTSTFLTAQALQGNPLTLTGRWGHVMGVMKDRVNGPGALSLWPNVKLDFENGGRDVTGIIQQYTWANDFHTVLSSIPAAVQTDSIAIGAAVVAGIVAGINNNKGLIAAAVRGAVQDAFNGAGGTGSEGILSWARKTGGA